MPASLGVRKERPGEYVEWVETLTSNAELKDDDIEEAGRGVHHLVDMTEADDEIYNALALNVKGCFYHSSGI